tara:strand:+ start:237 stop:479 length:243 start_codon:yes stop_codon:yes gene_type:complete
VVLSDRDELIIDAALDFGADYFYDIRNGTMGPTLYIEAPNKYEASRVRQLAPGHWNKLYVVVIYDASAPCTGSQENSKPV